MYCCPFLLHRARLILLLGLLIPASFLLLLHVGADDVKPAPRLDLRPGDRIAVIGNTLADRLQHDGWLDTYIHTRFPNHNLAFRHLGFSGDELTLRLRSAAFGTPDQWLTRLQADVIFAFFGYNESFAGPGGLEKFRKDLDGFVKHTLGQKYNGKSAPRLVLFSPIAHEDLKDPNLLDGKENNQRLALYTAAMAEVAKANHVPFVDLFAPTQELYQRAADANRPVPLTINGIHLTEQGNQQVAQVIDRALFGTAAEPKRDSEFMEKVRRAVIDRNFHWFNRYRTVDGYSIYGGRADLKFVAGQTNRDVMQREMEILDVMTANRDKVVWEVLASGGRQLRSPDDRNLPPFIPVTTNKPGPLPGGKHVFLDPEEAIKQMKLAPGLKVNLFASEKQFPELVNPVQMTWDPKGRLWVAVWPTYPHWKPTEPMNDKLLIFEDSDGDGKAEKMTVFADNLHCPTGFELYNGGVLVAQAPDLVFLKDTDGDDKADVRIRVLNGLCSADTHHTANSFVFDPGGALYFQEGTFHHTQVETPYGPPQRCANAGVFRYEPRSQKFEVYITFGFANPHGHVFDRWGQDIVIDGTGAQPYHAALFSGYLPFPIKHPKPPQVYQQKTRPCPGMEILSSRHFPEANQGNLLVANVIGFLGILQYKVQDKGASFSATEVEPILSSTDLNFRPSDIRIGPDGAIYFLDWHNPIIGHMQHNLRDPSRDREHGRIYRITCADRPLLKPAKIAGEPIDKLLDLLKEPEDRVRYRARIELSGRDSKQVVAAVQKWAANLDARDAEYQHHLLEALWVHQQHNVVNHDLLRRLLGSPDFRARAAATRVLCSWRERVPDALDLLKKQAADSHPRVRLEAIRAASFFTVPEAVEVVLVSQEHPTDIYLDYTRGETIHALDPHVKRAIAEKRPIHFTTAAGARYFLKSVGTDDLLKMERSQGVYIELLFRKGVREEYRKEALTGLARLEKKRELSVLLDGISQHVSDDSVAYDLVRILTSRPAGELAEVRGDLEKLAVSGKSPVIRQLGYVSLIAADGDVDRAWKLATRSVPSLQDLVTAMPLIRDPGQRARLYPRVEPLLSGLPKELADSAGEGKSVIGRYVRIELPGKQRTLTLAEVEVFSQGKNIARQGKASQKNTAFNGDASKAIDGNKSGAYSDGGQTHTQEGTTNPWWEVDLGGDYPIETIVVYNRTDSNLSNRLNNFTIKVLDGKRNTVFEKDKQPAPTVSATFEVGREPPDRTVRRLAMTALTSVRGKEADTFKAVARFVKDDADRHAAVQALQRIPPVHWPKDQAKPLLQDILGFVRKVPIADRTQRAVVDAMQLADALVAFLPLDEARAIRKELGELGVRVIRIGTVPDQMLFDNERVVVRAGKPFEIVFENTDLMPHNLVITEPGALEEIGNQAEAEAAQPGAMERHYVPRSKKVLLSSKLLQPRETQTLRWTAPSQPGVYPIVCTYPGHWRRMYGALYVVNDLDEYLANAEDYLKKNPLPIRDELLKFVRPRTEWKYEDLAGSVANLHGRSFTTGKQMFQVAACVSCHKMNGVGNEIGPDLTKIEPKFATPAEILRDIIDPSARINDKYQTYIFETKAGKVITGLVLEEKGDTVKIIENPLAKAEPIVLSKSDIAERTRSPNSIMPKGMLDKLTREEILDLIAYIVSKGDAKHMAFQGHEHKH